MVRKAQSLVAEHFFPQRWHYTPRSFRSVARYQDLNAPGPDGKDPRVANVRPFQRNPSRARELIDQTIPRVGLWLQTQLCRAGRQPALPKLAALMTTEVV